MKKIKNKRTHESYKYITNNLNLAKFDKRIQTLNKEFKSVKIIIILVLLLTVLLNGCNTAATPINELPMYGGAEKNQIELTADQKFINMMVSRFGSRENASNDIARQGWSYFYGGDLKTAMMRFNQSWLLNPNNSESFWGFGIILAMQSQQEKSIDKLNQSIGMLTKANDLSPKNARIIVDLAHSYTGKGWYISYVLKRDGEKYFDIADSLFLKASDIEPSYGLLYINWASNLFYAKKYKDAWNKIQKARILKANIPKELIKDLEKKMPNPYEE